MDKLNHFSTWFNSLNPSQVQDESIAPGNAPDNCPGLVEVATDLGKVAVDHLSTAGSISTGGFDLVSFGQRRILPWVLSKTSTMSADKIDEMNKIATENPDDSPQELYEKYKHLLANEEIPVIDQLNVPLSRTMDALFNPNAGEIKTEGQIDMLIEDAEENPLIHPSSVDFSNLENEGKKLSNSLSMMFIYDVAKFFLGNKLSLSLQDIQKEVFSGQDLSKNIDTQIDLFVKQLETTIDSTKLPIGALSKPIIKLIVRVLSYIIHSLTEKTVSIATNSTNESAKNNLHASNTIIGKLTSSLMDISAVKNGSALNTQEDCVDFIEKQKNLLRKNPQQRKKDYDAITKKIFQTTDTVYTPLKTSTPGKKILLFKELIAVKITKLNEQKEGLILPSHLSTARKIEVVFEKIMLVIKQFFNNIGLGSAILFFETITFFVDLVDNTTDFIARRLLTFICNKNDTLEKIATLAEESLSKDEVIDPLYFELLIQINKAIKKGIQKIQAKEKLEARALTLNADEKKVKALLDTFFRTADSSENSLEKVLKQLLESSVITQALGTKKLSSDSYQLILKVLTKEIGDIYGEITKKENLKKYLTKIMSGINQSNEKNMQYSIPSDTEEEKEDISAKINSQLRDLISNLAGLGATIAIDTLSLPTNQEKTQLRKDLIHPHIENFTSSLGQSDFSTMSRNDLYTYLQNIENVKKSISDANAKYKITLQDELNNCTYQFVENLQKHEQELFKLYAYKCSEELHTSQEQKYIDTKVQIEENIDILSSIDVEGKPEEILEKLLLLSKPAEKHNIPVHTSYNNLIQQLNYLSEYTEENIRALVLLESFEDDFSTNNNLFNTLNSTTGFIGLSLELRLEAIKFSRANIECQTFNKINFIVQKAKFLRSIEKAKVFAQETKDSFLELYNEHSAPPVVSTEDILEASNETLEYLTTQPAVAPEENIDTDEPTQEQSAVITKAIAIATEAVNPQFQSTVTNLLEFLKDPLFTTKLVRGIVIPSLNPKK